MLVKMKTIIQKTTKNNKMIRVNKLNNVAEYHKSDLKNNIISKLQRENNY